MKIDQVRAKEVGIDVSALGAGVRALVDGLNVGDFRLQGEAIDMLVMADPALGLDLDNLGQQPLAYKKADGSPGMTYVADVTHPDRTGACSRFCVLMNCAR